VALVPAAFVGVLTFDNYKGSYTAGRLAELEHLAAFNANILETYFGQLKANLETARDSYRIKNNLPALLRLAGNPADPEALAAKKILDGQLRPMQARLGLADIMLAGPDGTIVYASDGEHSKKEFLKSLPAPGRKAFAGGKSGVYVSEVFPNKVEGGRPGMLLVGPAADFASAFSGVIVFELDMEPVYKLTRDYTGLGASGEVLLGRLERDGALFLNPLRHDPTAALSRYTPIGSKNGLPLQKAVQGETGTGLAPDYRGKDVVAAWRYLPSLGWGLVAKIDAAEAFADLTRLRNLLLAILGLIFVVSGITALSLSRSVSVPLEKLAEGAAAVGGGNLDYKVGTSRRDEIGALSRAFDAMTENLKKTTASRDMLDAEVIERKRAEQERELYLADLKESESRVRLKIESILAPQGDIGKLELSDIIDAKEFQGLMDDFYALAKIPMAIIDLKGRVLVGVGWQDLCTKFHRVHPQACANCVESDTQLTAGVPPGEFRLYKCKNGLWDVATPIMLGGRHTGNLFIGQFFLQDDPPDREFFRAQAGRYGFDEAAYLAAFERIPRLRRESLDTTMGFFLKMAHIISRLSFGNISLARTLAEREELTGSLKESEQRLNKAQEIAHLGSWELDLVKNVLTWSDEAYRIFGYEPGEIAATYETFLEAVHPDDRALVNEAYTGSLREGRDTYETEHRVLRRGTGEVRYVHERCTHVRDGAGVIIRSVGMSHDITERRNREIEHAKLNRALRARGNSDQAMLHAESEQEYLEMMCRIIVEDCGHPFVWVGFAEQDEAKTVRPAAQAGFEAGYLKKLNITWGDGPTGRGPTGTAIRTGKPVGCGDIHTDPAFAPWRGEALARGYASTLALPLLAGGKAFGALNIYSKTPGSLQAGEEVALLSRLADDLAYGLRTMRLRAAHRLSEEEVQRMARVGVWELDLPTGQLTWSKELYRILEQDPETVSASVENFLALVHPEDREKVRGAYAGAAGPAAGELDYRLRMKDGRIKCVHESLTLVYGADGGQLRRMGTVHDVTEQKAFEAGLLAAQAELARAKRLSDIGTLAATVAHELRNPLATIGIAAVNIKRKAKNPDLQRHLDNIDKKVFESNQIINNLLFYSRLKPPHYERVAILDLLEESVGGAEENSKGSLSIGRDLGGLAGVYIEADPIQVREVLNNLLNNAADALEGGPGKIEVSGARENGSVRITVRDSGKGIDKETLDRAFDPFFTTKAKGTGLGLAVCRNIVDFHGGTIELQSEPGRGTAASVTLPCARPAGPAART